MSFEARLESLRRKHAFLNEELDYEVTRPMPNGAAIWRLKREKLNLKDKIAEIVRLTGANDDSEHNTVFMARRAEDEAREAVND